MKILNCYAYLGLLQFCFAFYGFSQEQNKKTINKLLIPTEIRENEKVKKCAEEVFRDCLQYTEEKYLPTYKEQMNRISFLDLNEVSGISYQNLSTVGLKVKCNPDLMQDTKETFDRETFNPLKYRFNFYANTTQYFLVEGTNILIILSPFKAD